MPDEHHKPCGVLYSRLKNAVQQDLSAIMKQLFSEKKIEAHKTLNDILLNTNNNEQQEHQAKPLPPNQENS